MPKYEVQYRMTGMWTDIVEADSKEDAERLIRGDGYEIPEDPDEWSDFEIDWIGEYTVYGFLCEDPKNPDYHAYGIKYSEYDDGECELEVRWFPNKEGRDAQVEIDKCEGIVFLTEDENED